MLNPLNKFLHFQPLPAAATRRQLLLSGLGLAIAAFGSRSATAAQQEHITKSAPAPKPPGSKKLVMIDPGHGGIDSGAVGHEGSEEKHVVLEIANYVRECLASHSNIEVKLTRDSDHFIPLYQRVEIASTRLNSSNITI